jgi:hypothetical protein
MRIASRIGAIAAAAAIACAAPAFAGVDFSDQLVQVSQISPGMFDFSEGGFSAGAKVTGSFAGTDLDGNGQLSSFEGEVTAFDMAFSGNAEVFAFTRGLPDLFGLVYDLNGGPLGDGTTGDVEGIGVFTLPGYIVGPGPLGNVCDGTNVCGEVFSVPEPATWAILLLGFGGVGATLRQSRSRRGVRAL